MSFPSVNIRISGVSVSGDIDAGASPVTIQMANSDGIGYATFALQNRDGTHSYIKNSGSPTVEIDFNGTTEFRGYIERIDPSISVNAGSTIVCHAYDKGEELLYMISPDARQPPPTWPSLTSGDQGITAPDGIDLVQLVSGLNVLSGATVAQFMSQFFGTETDPSGSFSGTMYSFKPHISGYTYDTWYKPDGSPDNNLNYWIPLGTLKVTREYAWDTLRRLTRGGVVLDSTGSRISLESYVGVSGDIHIFTSGSSEFLASGANGQLTLIYYGASKSGSNNNNIISMVIPHDSTLVKNRVIGWFKDWTKLPLDSDNFTDVRAYSGARWSGYASSAPAGMVATLSGFFVSKSGFGNISIQTSNSGTPTTVEDNRVELIGTVQSGTLNILTFAGLGVPVTIHYDYYYNHNSTTPSTTFTAKSIILEDINGNFIYKSGIPPYSISIPGIFTFPKQPNGIITPRTTWGHSEDTLFDGNGVFNSGNGYDGGWAASATFPDLAQVKIIKIGMNFYQDGTPWAAPTQRSLAIDLLYFSFNYRFSPIVAFNSGSQGLYRRRYEPFEYPTTVTDTQASGIITAYLNSFMGSKQVGEAIVKDREFQTTITPGQVTRIDAPVLNTGSGMRFDYWRVIAVDHNYSTTQGFLTHLRVVPWYSGTLVDPNTNLVDYTFPFSEHPTRGDISRADIGGMPIWRVGRWWTRSNISMMPTDKVT